jgi:CRP-like cAMP-binding protein
MTTNLLLNSLSPDLFGQMKPYLRTVELAVHAPISEADEPIELVYFPQSGMISLIVELLNGSKIETAMIGREGVANAGAAINGGFSLGAATVQVAGRASVMEPKRFARFTSENPSLFALVGMHEQIVQAQTQQSSACHAAHSADQRMCRWLLQLRDILRSDRLHLTQEFLAQMLGVQRASVSVVAVNLRDKALIQYSRGTIDLLDVDGLRRHSCECYEAVKTLYTRLPSAE